MCPVKIGLKPENPLEALGLALGLVPLPMGETLPPLLLTRALMAAARFGVIKTLAEGPRTAREIAARCGTHPAATRTLLDTLVGSNYFQLEGDRYTLAPLARKWLAPDSPVSLHDNLLYRYLEWDWIGRLDEYLQGGEPLHIHREMSRDQWELYQRGMLAVARLGGAELAARAPVPRGARDMLDLGGSHGFYAVAICRRHPRLRAVVFDLPEAVEHAAPLLDVQEMGERVVHRAGDALAEDFGTDRYDFILVSQLAHHFDGATNRELVGRLARALRPGGVLAILELLRRQSPKEGGQIGALLDLYFALTSESGTWTFDEMAEWARGAGLAPRKPMRFRTLPGLGMQAAARPR
jgi:SAM-dependent methyltransferase